MSLIDLKNEYILRDVIDQEWLKEQKEKRVKKAKTYALVGAIIAIATFATGCASKAGNYKFDRSLSRGMRYLEETDPISANEIEYAVESIDNMLDESFQIFESNRNIDTFGASDALISHLEIEDKDIQNLFIKLAGHIENFYKTGEFKSGLQDMFNVAYNIGDKGYQGERYEYVEANLYSKLADFYLRNGVNGFMEHEFKIDFSGSKDLETPTEITDDELYTQTNSLNEMKSVFDGDGISPSLVEEEKDEFITSLMLGAMGVMTSPINIANSTNDMIIDLFDALDVDPQSENAEELRNTIYGYTTSLNDDVFRIDALLISNASCNLVSAKINSAPGTTNYEIFDVIAPEIADVDGAFDEYINKATPDKSDREIEELKKEFYMHVLRGLATPMSDVDEIAFVTYANALTKHVAGMDHIEDDYANDLLGIMNNRMLGFQNDYNAGKYKVNPDTQTKAADDKKVLKLINEGLNA